MLPPLVLNMVLFFYLQVRSCITESIFYFVIMYVNCNTYFFSSLPLKGLSKPNAYRRFEIWITENVRDGNNNWELLFKNVSSDILKITDVKRTVFFISCFSGCGLCHKAEVGILFNAKLKDSEEHMCTE